jgi:hypothetical protein
MCVPAGEPSPRTLGRSRACGVGCGDQRSPVGRYSLLPVCFQCCVSCYWWFKLAGQSAGSLAPQLGGSLGVTAGSTRQCDRERCRTRRRGRVPARGARRIDIENLVRRKELVLPRDAAARCDGRIGNAAGGVSWLHGCEARLLMGKTIPQFRGRVEGFNRRTSLLRGRIQPCRAIPMGNSVFPGYRGGTGRG